jgi:hypothetical protein
MPAVRPETYAATVVAAREVCERAGEIRRDAEDLIVRAKQLTAWAERLVGEHPSSP